jgi:DNA polymerase elongation subunit (family B)
MDQPTIEDIKKEGIVFDIETCSSYPDGRPVDIRTNFEDYVKYAKCKWIGMYSYKFDRYIGDLVRGNEEAIRDFIGQHKILIGFNSEEFDTPICYNNDLIPEGKFLQVDLLVILGSSAYKRHDGLPFKNRGALMGYKFGTNSLRNIAQGMQLDVQKGDIDYMIFFKDDYTPEEVSDIKKYLEADVMVTKDMFEKVWDFWLPFTEYLSDSNVKNLSWIKSSIASLTYKAACHTLGVPETYGEKGDSEKEKMGGRVIQPKYEEARNVWYVDFTSLYPHIFAMFNLFAEITQDEIDKVGIAPGNRYDLKIWHGNDVFKVKGYYDISQPHPLCEDVKKKLVLRSTLSKDDPKRYAVKIFLNSLYGAARSPIFEQVYTPNCGWDCCWLGQQINHLTEDMMKDFGFETIAGDTDSIFVIAHSGTPNEEWYVRECLQKVVKKITDNVPFPVDTYNIDIEDYLSYVKWPFSLQPKLDDDGNKIYKTKIDKEGNTVKTNRLVKAYQGLKKNYLYITDGKIKLTGLPIIKDNATALGKKLYKEEIEPYILEHQHASMPKEEMKSIIKRYLDKPENVKLLAREFKVKEAKSYKKPSQLQAQISQGYFGGQDGVAYLIKNRKVGRAGKTSKYCTVEELLEAKLTLTDIDLVKLYNEMQPFMESEKK